MEKCKDKLGNRSNFMKINMKELPVDQLKTVVSLLHMSTQCEHDISELIQDPHFCHGFAVCAFFLSAAKFLPETIKDEEFIGLFVTLVSKMLEEHGGDNVDVICGKDIN